MEHWNTQSSILTFLPLIRMTIRMILSQKHLLDLTKRARETGKFAVPEYDLDEVGIGIVHLGPGAFHRAHQAAYTEAALNLFGGNWGICGVSMRSSGVKDTLLPQDNLYTLAILDEEVKYQIIGAMKEVLVASKDLAKVLDRMSNSATKIISLTITEKGYCLDTQGNLDLNHPDITHDLASPDRPISAVGLITEALRLRKDKGIAAFNVISCDNLPGNGHKLGEAVKQYAKQFSSKLAEWVEENVSFPCTMVDSITPKTEDYIVEEVSSIIGAKDEWPIQREEFTQWVIEDNFKGERPAWEKVGVIFSDDIDGFENAKLRILNGMHSTLAYLGTLAGFTTVKEAISDPTLFELVNRLVQEEIIPSLTPPDELAIDEYSDSIVRRFQNPQIKHLLSQIAWDGSKKLPVRIFDTIVDNLNARRPIKLLSLCIAAWIRFLRVASVNNTEVVDPRAEELLSTVSCFTDEASSDVNILLNLPGLVPPTLLSKSEFITEVTDSYGLLLENNRLTLDELNDL